MLLCWLLTRCHQVLAGKLWVDRLGGCRLKYSTPFDCICKHTATRIRIWRGCPVGGRLPPARLCAASRVLLTAVPATTGNTATHRACFVPSSRVTRDKSRCCSSCSRRSACSCISCLLSAHTCCCWAWDLSPASSARREATCHADRTSRGTSR